MNLYLIGAGILIVAILAAVAYKYFKKPASLSTLETSLKAHVETMIADLRAELHPVAPAASVAAPPPAAASAGSGGTIVVTASDAVVAKHAQLDQVIATHQAAIVDATAQKAAVTAAQDALNKLVA